MTSYRDWVVELSNTTGIGTYGLAGPPAGTSYFSYRQRYSDGEDEVVFWAINASRTKWEKNRFSTLTYGAMDTLTRNVVESTNGDAPVPWVGGDLPLRLYVVPDSDAQEFVIKGGAAPTTRPPISKEAAIWPNTAAGWSARVPFNVNPAGTEREVGSFEGSVGGGIYRPSPRIPVLANGAANLTLAAGHIGWWITFDTSAAQRTATLPAGSSVGMGYTARLQPTSDVFPLAVAPNGSDAIDSLAGGTSFFAHGKRYFDIMWDGTKWQTSIADAPLLITRQGNAVQNIDVQNIPANIHSMDIEFNCHHSANDAGFGLQVYDSGGSLINGASTYTYFQFIYNQSGINQAGIANTLMLWNFHGATILNTAVWGFEFKGKMQPMQSTNQGVKLGGELLYLDASSNAHAMLHQSLRNAAGRVTGIRVTGTVAANILSYDLRLKGYSRL